MPAALEYISNHPLYGVGAALLLAFIVLTIVKKLVGIALVLVVGFIGYSYFLHTKGEEEHMPSLQRMVEEAKEKAKAVEEKAKEVEQRAKDALEKK
jgi:hypothetical protein